MGLGETTVHPAPCLHTTAGSLLIRAMTAPERHAALKGHGQRREEDRGALGIGPGGKPNCFFLFFIYCNKPAYLYLKLKSLARWEI